MGVGEPVDVDFQKALDGVPHQRLLRKLHRQGIRGQVLLWSEYWWRTRKRRVAVSGQFSPWREEKSGVPLGSVLGPVLFNLPINDLETGISSEVAIFADDTKLSRLVKTRRDCEELQKDLSKLGEWVAKWQMCFSMRKCKVMHIGAIK